MQVEWSRGRQGEYLVHIKGGAGACAVRSFNSIAELEGAANTSLHSFTAPTAFPRPVITHSASRRGLLIPCTV